MQKIRKVWFNHQMVVFLNEILHIPLLHVLILCNHKFNTTSTASDIPWPPQLDLPQVLLYAENFTAANKHAKGPLIVVVVPLVVILAHTKSFLISVVVIKLNPSSSLLNIFVTISLYSSKELSLDISAIKEKKVSFD
jgi:hypothetical protein